MGLGLNPRSVQRQTLAPWSGIGAASLHRTAEGGSALFTRGPNTCEACRWSTKNNPAVPSLETPGPEYPRQSLWLEHDALSATVAAAYHKGLRVKITP